MRTAIQLLSLSLPLIFLLGRPFAAQSATSPAGALAGQALWALTRGQPVTSIRLTGSAVRTAGADTESGTIVLESAGAGLSRVDLDLAAGRRTSVRFWRGARPGSAPGAAVQDGAAHTLGLADSWWPAAWFDPVVLLEAAQSPGFALTAPGANRLRVARNVASRTKGMAEKIAELSQADLQLDPATALPVSLAFRRHPGGHVNFSLPVEIRYSDWRPVAGVEVPFHIERWITGTRELVITVTAAEVNTPLAASEFHLGGAQ